MPNPKQKKHSATTKITILITTTILLTQLIKSDETKAKNDSNDDPSVIKDYCQWEMPSYDSKDYLRVIRKMSSYYPLKYLCWDRKTLQGAIFYNTINCVLAISDKDGVDCLLCDQGYKPVGGHCVVIPAPKKKGGSGTGSGGSGTGTGTGGSGTRGSASQASKRRL